MSLLCNLFGHPMQSPYFTADGRWHSECIRGDLKIDGVVPPQHQHVYGPKFRRANIWYWACACGHVTEAPVPVPRKSLDAKKG